MRAVSGNWEAERVAGTTVGRGYSGSPVLSRRTDAVAGMLCTSDLAGSAHLVPGLEILRALREIVGVQVNSAQRASWHGLLDDEQIRAGGWPFPGPLLRGYLKAAAVAAADDPFRVLLPGIEAPLSPRSTCARACAPPCWVGMTAIRHVTARTSFHLM